jgi:hypothetical protein
MPSRRSSKKDSPAKLTGRMKRRWRVVLLRSKGEILGQVAALTRKRRKLPQRSSLIWTKSSATGLWCRSLAERQAVEHRRSPRACIGLRGALFFEQRTAPQSYGSLAVQELPEAPRIRCSWVWQLAPVHRRSYVKSITRAANLARPLIASSTRDRLLHRLLIAASDRARASGSLDGYRPAPPVAPVIGIIVIPTIMLPVAGPTNVNCNTAGANVYPLSQCRCRSRGSRCCNESNRDQRCLNPHKRVLSVPSLEMRTRKERARSAWNWWPRSHRIMH